jgi:hypothetical protein
MPPESVLLKLSPATFILGSIGEFGSRVGTAVPSSIHSGISVASSLIFSFMLSRRRRSTALWDSRLLRRFSEARRSCLSCGAAAEEDAGAEGVRSVVFAEEEGREEGRPAVDNGVPTPTPPRSPVFGSDPG